jgi:NADH-quinone oxidoreductase subunit L
MIQAIVFFPLIGALIAGLLGRIIGTRASEYIATGLLLAAAVLAWIVFLPIVFGGGYDQPAKVTVLEWVHSGALSLDWTLRVDTLTAVMLVVVTTVSSLVHVYSIGYMAEDAHPTRFFSYLSAFSFAMLMLVTSDNFLQMFFGWEGVGLMSYLLIGFWYDRPAANAAAIKAFVVNRVGDVGFLLGIFGALAVLGNINFDQAFAAVPAHQGDVIHFLWSTWPAMTVVCLLLFMGAMGKSAQFLLHTWLPDAMEGPTPVSALIHAATMVTAGVFMVARLSPLFEAAPGAQMVVLYVGAITAFFAATVGLVQNDIKKVIAYSTCSQLGYMFVALGAGVYSAGIFHLFTHAFFKGLLFLCAGSVIHAMHHEQDMRKMGGLRHKIPVTYWTMLIGTFALTGLGIPGTPLGFAGFFSKDAIIEAAYGVGGTNGGFAFWSLVIAAGMTSFYSYRLIFLTFHGKPKGGAEPAPHHSPSHTDTGDEYAPVPIDHQDEPIAHYAYDHAHESPNSMLIALYVLAAGSVLTGTLLVSHFAGQPEQVAEFFKGAVAVRDTAIEAAHSAPFWAKSAATIAMLVGFVLAWYCYIRAPATPKRLAQANPGLYQFLLHKWYFDELYDLVFVKGANWVGRAFWRGFDDWLIDKTLVEGLGRRVKDVTGQMVRLQSGYLYHYAFAMLIGIAALLTWAIAAGGLHG